MGKETEALLRGILFNAKRAKSVEEITSHIEAMCSKEDVDSVDTQIAKLREAEKNKDNT